jgi:hypothetical protein
MTALIDDSLPSALKAGGILRIHVAGDFFSSGYMSAWINIAIKYPNTIFYAYTKSLMYWLHHRDTMPSNFRLTASKGGAQDILIEKQNLKYAEVVFSEDEAKQKGLEIDTDDRLAIESNDSFALLLHGTQPKNSEAAAALKEIRNGNKNKASTPVSADA